MGRALDYGMVAINRVKITGAPIPFGGVKQSGLGREGSRHGSKPSPISNISASTRPEAIGSPRRNQTCSTARTNSPPGTATTSSIPRPIWARMRAASRRPASSPAARASTSPTSTASKSLDAFAGLYCVNVGYGRQKIADAIAEQAKNLAYYHAYVGHGTEASITLAKMIIDRAPEGHEPRLFRPVGLGRQRDQHQADLVLQQRARPAGEEEDHLALARLSRLRRDDRLADRARPLPQRLRPAARADPAHRGALLFPPRRPLDERGAVLAASAPTSSRR